MMLSENTPLSLPCQYLTWETVLRIRHTISTQDCAQSAQYSQTFPDGWAQHTSQCASEPLTVSAQNFDPQCSTAYAGTSNHLQYVAPQRSIVQPEPGIFSRPFPRRPQALNLSMRKPHPPPIISPRPQRPAQEFAALRSLNLRDLPREEREKCHIQIQDSSDSEMDEDDETAPLNYPPPVSSPSAVSNATSSPFSPQDSFPMTPQGSFFNQPDESNGCTAESSYSIDDTFDFDGIFSDTGVPIESKDPMQHTADQPLFPDIPADMELPLLTAADIDFLMQCGLPEEWVRASAEVHNSNCSSSTQDASTFSEACTYDASYQPPSMYSSSYQYMPE